MPAWFHPWYFIVLIAVWKTGGRPHIENIYLIWKTGEDLIYIGRYFQHTLD